MYLQNIKFQVFCKVIMMPFSCQRSLIPVEKQKKTSIQIHTYDFCYLYLKVRVFLKVFMFPLCSCFLNLDVPKFFDMTRLFMLRMMRTKSYILFNVRKIIFTFILAIGRSIISLIVDSNRCNSSHIACNQSHTFLYTSSLTYIDFLES